MMAKNTTATATITVRKPPSVNCGGFIDAHGTWNNGFACPVQHVCCDIAHFRYCCSLDHYLSEINAYNEQIYITGSYQSSNDVLIHRNSSISSMKNVHQINQQFEQFQKLFLPIFLLTSSVLFLVGIAIWFWLYKHKAYYAMEREAANRLRTKGLGSASNRRRRESINLTMDQPSRRISHPSTDV